MQHTAGGSRSARSGGQVAPVGWSHHHSKAQEWLARDDRYIFRKAVSQVMLPSELIYTTERGKHTHQGSLSSGVPVVKPSLANMHWLGVLCFC